MTTPNKEILSTGEVSRLFGVCKETIRVWTRDGKLTGFRTLGGHYRYEVKQLLPLLMDPPGEEGSDSQTDMV